MAEAITGTAAAQDGCILAYRIYPNPGKPRLALIHSLALGMGIWDESVDELQRDFEILTYDCRGHGQSERRRGAYTVRLFADDLAAILDHVGWPSTTIAGCSMGGCVAQAFASRYKDRARSVALIDTTAWYGSSAPEEWRKRAAKAAEDGFPKMLPFQLSRWFSDNFLQGHAERVHALAQTFVANDVACYQASCALLGNMDLRSEISSIHVPVSVIVGEED